jgi:arylsulfatase A-like enzyme/tetratricopeptide (TPR) repeat protein
VVLAAVVLFVALPRGERDRPNVLLITIDTLRWDHVGVYGASGAETPTLDGLAARGVRFETAIMHAPLTAPSHASILTGLIPVRHGVRDNGAFFLPAALPTLATILKTAGYTTAGFVSGFPLERRFGFSNGFETYDDTLPSGSARTPDATERHADETTGRVIDWIDRRRTGTEADRPWLLWVHYFDPHAAYDPPAEYMKRFGAHPYDGEIAFVDAQIGRLAKTLEAHGDLARTIVLVTADHGESLGDHREETHGVFIYDATLRVPWIVAGPGVPSGRVAGVVAHGVDVLPTLLDLAGVRAPPAIDGRSLRPAIEGQSMADEPAYIESLLAKRQFGWAPLRGMRDARWKYIEAPTPELYDLSADRTETVNRMTNGSAHSAELARALAAASSAPTPDASQRVAPDAARRLRALGYVGTTSGSPPGGSGRDPKEGIALVTRLEHAIAAAQDDPTGAVDALRAVIAEDSGLVVAHRQLAAALVATGDRHGAIDEVEWLEGHGAATAEDMLLKSEALRVTGSADDAQKALAQAAILDPRSPEVPLTEARSLVAAGRSTEAEAAYGRALDLAPDSAEALTGLGNVRLAAGDLDRAGGFFERAVASHPSDIDARLGLALVRGRQGRMPDAIALLQEVVRDAPANGQALAALGAGLARTGSPAAAVPYFERAIGAGVRTSTVLNGLGFARLESGDRAGALDALRASLDIDPRQSGVQQAVRDLSAGGPGRVVR